MRLFPGRLPENRSLFSRSGENGYVAKKPHVSTYQAKGGVDSTQQKFLSIALSKAWAQPK